MDFEPWRLRFERVLRLRNRSPFTVRSYGRSLRVFFGYLVGLGVERLADVTREHVEDYRTHLFYRRHRDRPLTMKTQMLELCAVRAFFRAMLREQYLLADPAAELELPRPAPQALPELLSEAEMVRLLEDGTDRFTRQGCRDRAILEVLYATGIRNLELRRLQLRDLDLALEELTVLGKGAKPRRVPLGEEAVGWLRAYLAVRGESPLPWVFLSRRSRPLHSSTLGTLVQQAADRAGLNRRVTPHLMRHSCATHMLRNGAGLRHLQKLLGHESLSTTQRYTRVEIADLRAVHRRCHPREQGRAS